MNGWKKICFSFTFMVGGVAIANATTSAPTSIQTTITMKDSEGRVQRFSKANSSEIAAIFTTPIHDANVFVMKARHANCKKLAQNIEYLMELPFIIEALNNSKPPILSESHKETLSRVPLCEPYLLDLKIIALQLNGWKLEKKEVATTEVKRRRRGKRGRKDKSS